MTGPHTQDLGGDLSVLAEVAGELIALFEHAPGVLTSPLFLARVMQSAVEIYRAGQGGEEELRAAAQIAVGQLKREFRGEH